MINCSKERGHKGRCNKNLCPAAIYIENSDYILFKKILLNMPSNEIEIFEDFKKDFMI